MSIGLHFGHHWRRGGEGPIVMQIDQMKSSQSKLVISLGLVVVAAVLMCLGIRWLFFVGLALVGLSRLICWIEQRSGKRTSGIIYWLAGSGLLLWLSSFGRE